MLDQSTVPENKARGTVIGFRLQRENPKRKSIKCEAKEKTKS
jgi:hypothetical protein